MRGVGGACVVCGVVSESRINVSKCLSKNHMFCRRTKCFGARRGGNTKDKNLSRKPDQGDHGKDTASGPLDFPP